MIEYVPGKVAWFEANHGLQGGKLKDIMANEEFFNYNLNGYTYRGLSEIEKLWAPQHMPSAFDLRKLYAKLTVTGTEKVGDADAYVIEAGVPEGGAPTKMYFDTQTGLLVRVESEIHDADGVSHLREDLSDYRAIGPVTISQRKCLKRLSESLKAKQREWTTSCVNACDDGWPSGLRSGSGMELDPRRRRWIER